MGPPPGYNTALIAAAVVIGVVLVALAAYLAIGGDDDGGFEISASTTTTSVTLPPSSTPTTTPTTAQPSSASTATTATTSASSVVTSPTSTPTSAGITTTSTPASTTSTSTGSPVPSTPDVVWPDPGETTGFDTPEDAAHGFAVDLAGFREPLIGEFRAGDGRSGEIEIRPSATGPVTVVLLRQVTADDSWWVIGAVTDDIDLDTPRTGDVIEGSLQLSGRARAFEGHVTITVHRHGDDEPIAQSFVTGRGDGVLGPFEKQLDVYPPTPGPGLVLLVAPSAEDGSAWAVTAVPISLR